MTDASTVLTHLHRRYIYYYGYGFYGGLGFGIFVLFLLIVWGFRAYAASARRQQVIVTTVPTQQVVYMDPGQGESLPMYSPQPNLNGYGAPTGQQQPIQPMPVYSPPPQAPGGERLGTYATPTYTPSTTGQPQTTANQYAPPSQPPPASHNASAFPVIESQGQRQGGNASHEAAVAAQDPLYKY
ncbi:hypothetical protein HDU79_002052 [Rhizoclosmatium sp. JEL0117]|nr:hypothetical protein HDU79_002052 [Rhizoclosmatium sp. JEL0117]